MVKNKIAYLATLVVACVLAVEGQQNREKQDHRLTIGLNFTGSTYGVDSFVFPPDTMGAVGPHHIVELLNGVYSVYRKSDGVRIQTSSLSEFWSNAGAPPHGFVADSRLLYDRFSERWFASTGDFVGAPGDNLLLAVSESSDPTAGWTGFLIPFDGLVNNFIDFPTLGVNDKGVYLSTNLTVLVLPKSDLLATPPTVANATVLKDFALGSPAQPVVNLDNTGLPEAVLTGSNVPGGIFHLSNIIGDINSPALGTSDGLISVIPFVGLGNIGAEQPDSDVGINAGTLAFTSSIVLINGVFWGVEGVANQGRAALRWFAIDASTNMLLQEGLIADVDQDFQRGSIAVNKFGDVVIGFNASSKSLFVSSYAVRGTTVNGVTTFGMPVLLKAGVAPYNLTGGSLTARWGDYSATVADPKNPFVFWTFQEWPSSPDVWSTQVTELCLRRCPSKSR